MLETHEQVVVLAGDILSSACHSNFESMRILDSSENGPWQHGSAGFVLGEAAVDLLLRRAGNGGAPIGRPVLSQDLSGSDGLDRVLAASTSSPELIIGQGTGPQAVDDKELASLSSRHERAIPIATPVADYGHTLGGSVLLSLALLCAGAELSPNARMTTDGRPIAYEIPKRARALVSCRALGGACGVVATESHSCAAPSALSSWADPAGDQLFGSPAIRDLVVSAVQCRPQTPPSALVVWLERPLLPPERARRGGRILPSAVVEMTPGFTAMSVARAWGYAGPTLCLVGGAPPGPSGFDASILGENVSVVDVRPYWEAGYDQVAIEWTHAG
jgi:hypothetical protein